MNAREQAISRSVTNLLEVILVFCLSLKALNAGGFAA
jgi:hypothetical protein